MYKLMIVDDDKPVRDRLKMAIPFDELRLELCCEASDGEEALELFNRHRPQIVITDINIPLVNGLEFARHILGNVSEIGVIIITAYGSLEFAREAIKSGISDFLLKPVNDGEMRQSLERVIERLDARAEAYRRERAMENLIRESLPILQQRYLISLLNNMIEDSEDSCREHLSHLGMELRGQYYCVAVLIPDYYEHGEKDRELIQIAIENISLEVVRSAGIECILFFDELSRPVIVAFSDDKNIGVLLEKQLSSVRDKLRFYFSYDFAAGVGWRVDSLMELPRSFSGAERALGYKNSFGENNVVNIENVPLIGLPVAQSVRAERDSILEVFRNCDEEGLNAELQKFFGRLIVVFGVSEAFAKQMYLELIMAINNSAWESGVDIDVLLEGDTYSKVLLSTSLNMVHRHVSEHCIHIMELIKEKRKDRASRLIEQAKRYIRENISKPELDLTMVGEHIGLSGSYLCSLFRREVGCNFVEYLNRERVEQAKTLLSTTNMRVYEVAVAVGYLNPKYFFQVFKRITNKRPREFSKEV